MITELRKTKRIIDYLPIELTVQHGVTGELVAGPFSSRIIDISASGACLLVTQVIIDNYHIFHSTREDDSLFLQLSITLPPDIMDFNISARPIWMDLFRQDDIRAFKMGVEFMINPEGKQMKQLVAALARQQKKRAAKWLSNNPRMIKVFSLPLFSGR